VDHTYIIIIIVMTVFKVQH